MPKHTRISIAALALGGTVAILAPTGAFAATGEFVYTDTTATLLIQPEYGDTGWTIEFNDGIGGPAGESPASVTFTCIDGQWVYSEEFGGEIVSLPITSVTLYSIAEDVTIDRFELDPALCGVDVPVIPEVPEVPEAPVEPPVVEESELPVASVDAAAPVDVPELATSGAKAPAQLAETGAPTTLTAVAAAAALALAGGAVLGARRIVGRP